jgi:hypothetical protein
MPVSARAAGALLVSLSVLGSAAAQAQDTCATAYESAQELRRGRELARSRVELRLCERACPKKLAEDCSGWRREVEAELASVILDARDAEGRTIVGARVTADGAPLGASIPAEPVELDPGAHVLVFEDEAGGRVRVEIKLAPGEKGRAVSVRFPRPPPPLSSAPPPPSARAHSAAPYVLGIAGLAGLTAGAILGIKGQVERASLERSCAPTCNKATQVDPIATEWLAGAVSAVAGTALLGAGVAVWVGEERAGRAPARVVLAPGPRWLGVKGRF